MATTRNQVHRYTAFTLDPAGGNPAGVVLEADDLDEQTMQVIAAEVGYSETAFVTAVPGNESGRTFDVRYFSPKLEVPFCGHATIATAVALAERIGVGELEFRTAAGVVPVEVGTTPDGALTATLASVAPYVEDVADDDVAEALGILGWGADEIDRSTLPPRIAYAGARHLVLAAVSRARLAALNYDFERLASYMTARDLTTLQLVWRESESVFHVRNPFPVGGVVEDPATGAAAAAFGAYLRALGVVEAAASLTLHQGVDMGRPSLLAVELRSGESRVRVTGTAVLLPS